MEGNYCTRVHVKESKLCSSVRSSASCSGEISGAGRGGDAAGGAEEA